MRAVVRATADAASLSQRLRREIEGDVLFDAASRGRYATDASIYQIDPIGVVVPKTEHDVQVMLQIARESGIPVLPRGGGTSQCGQTVGAALVIDTSKHLRGVVEIDAQARLALVEPGLVLDHLNALLRPHGLWFPVDVSTSAQATLGGMAGNNSCGPRSIRYGNMVHNVEAIDAWLADGAAYRFGPVGDVASAPAGYRALVQRIHAIAGREAAEIDSQQRHANDDRQCHRNINQRQAGLVVPEGPRRFPGFSYWFRNHVAQLPRPTVRRR